MYHAMAQPCAALCGVARRDQCNAADQILYMAKATRIITHKLLIKLMLIILIAINKATRIILMIKLLA